MKRALLLAFVLGYLLCAAQMTWTWCAAMRHGSTPMRRCIGLTAPFFLLPWAGALDDWSWR